MIQREISLYLPQIFSRKILQVDVNDDNYLNSFVIYSTKDVPVRITLDGGGGKGNSNHRGGKGGRTIFDYTLLANTEYVLKLGKTVGPAQSSGGGVLDHTFMSKELY